jgi:hypothetical protein
MTFEQLITEIRTLPLEQRKALIVAIVDTFTEPQVPQHSLLELEGLGKEIWQGIDAQEYVDQLRDEWNHRP